MAIGGGGGGLGNPPALRVSSLLSRPKVFARDWTATVNCPKKTDRGSGLRDWGRHDANLINCSIYSASMITTPSPMARCPVDPYPCKVAPVLYSPSHRALVGLQQAASSSPGPALLCSSPPNNAHAVAIGSPNSDEILPGQGNEMQVLATLSRPALPLYLIHIVSLTPCPNLIKSIWGGVSRLSIP